MEIHRKGFTGVIKDNDEMYIRHICGFVESRDELSSLEIFKTPCGYKFRIAPSMPKYINHIMSGLIKINNIYGIHLNFSKSIKSSSVITFDIETNN